MSNNSHTTGGEARNVNIVSTKASAFTFILGVMITAIILGTVGMYHSLNKRIESLSTSLGTTNQILITYIKNK